MIPGPRRMTTYEWTWTTGGGKSKAALLAKSEKWGTQLYNHVDPADELYGDVDDPLEITAL